jgi:hypothetical protein
MDTAIRNTFAVFVITYLAMYVLYEVMVFSVNRRLTSSESVSLIPLREWRRLLREHTRLFPRSGLRPLMVGCLVAVLSLAALLVVVSLWSYYR